MLNPFVLALLLSPTPRWDAIGDALDKIAATRGFAPGVRIQSDPRGIVYTYKRGKDASLSVDVSQAIDVQNLPLAKWNMEHGAAGGARTQTAPSGAPLGDFCFVAYDYVQLGGEEYILESHVSTRQEGEPRTLDRRLQEAMVRVAFAEAVGGSLDATGAPSKAWSRTLLSRPRAGYYPLAALTLGARLGEWGDRATFALGGRTVELVLGSDTATVDGKSVPLGAFVVRRGGTWLVPADALLKATGTKAAKGG